MRLYLAQAQFVISTIGEILLVGLEISPIVEMTVSFSL
jgi:hypothetical protein